MVWVYGIALGVFVLVALGFLIWSERHPNEHDVPSLILITTSLVAFGWYLVHVGSSAQMNIGFVMVILGFVASFVLLAGIIVNFDLEEWQDVGDFLRDRGAYEGRQDHKTLKWQGTAILVAFVVAGILILQVVHPDASKASDQPAPTAPPPATVNASEIPWAFCHPHGLAPPQGLIPAPKLLRIFVCPPSGPPILPPNFKPAKSRIRRF